MTILPESGFKVFLRHYWWTVGLAIAALVVLVLAPLASSDPDGLERVAEDQQFLDSGKSSGPGWLPDYTIPGLSGDLSTVLSGLIGVAVVFGVIFVLGRVMARRRA